MTDFAVLFPRQFCLLLSLFILPALPVEAGRTPPKVLLRIYVQTTGEGLSPQQAMTIPLPPNGEQIQIRALPEVSERDLVDIKSEPGGFQLFFNHQGQVNLSAVTAQNQGRILVLMIDGMIVYAPIIDQQITSGELDVPHPINAQVIQALQELAQKNVREAAKR